MIDSTLPETSALARRRRSILLVCGLSLFVDVVGSGIVVPAVPEFAALFGASDAAMGYSFAAFAAAFLLAILPLGYIVDRTGNNQVVVVGGLVSITAAALCFASAESIWVYSLGHALHGAGSAAVWVAAQPLAARVIGASERIGLWFSSITIAMGLGLVVGPIIGIIGTFRTPFWIYVALAGGSCLLAAAVLRGTRAPDHVFEYHVWTVLRNRWVAAAGAAVFVLYAGIGMAEVLFPLYMDALGYSKSGIGALFALLALVMVVSQPLAGRWIDRVGPWFPAGLGLAFVAVTMAVAALGSSYFVWAPSFGLMGLAVGVPVSASMVMIATGSLAAHHGAAYSVWNFSFALGYLLGPVLGGTIAHAAALWGAGEAGSLRIPFLAYSVCVLLALLPLSRLLGSPRHVDRLEAGGQ
jgi:DHA1 family solute carrier family 18 vesicular amine transporter 1/2